MYNNDFVRPPFALRGDKYQEVLNVLLRFQGAGFESAIIAGGFWRDVVHGIEPRDIDLFIADPWLGLEDTQRHLATSDCEKDNGISKEALASIVGVDVECVVDNIEMDTADNYDLGVMQVWTVLKDGMEIQVISTTQVPVDHVNINFDIGLCRIYHDGNKLVLTDEFLVDAFNQTLTVYGEYMSETQYRYTRETHIPRFQDKYPNHEIRWCPHARLLEKDYQKNKQAS